MTDVYQYLDQHGIAYRRYDHPAFFTAVEASAFEEQLPDKGGCCKNLFLTDEKKQNLFLVVLPSLKKAQLKELSRTLGTKNLSFASPALLLEHLGVTPGSVSLLGLINDTDHRVQVILDADLWQSETVYLHPNINTATLAIARSDIEKLLLHWGNPYRVLSL
jgi:Ala-tRNA(Pro) deacylase